MKLLFACTILLSIVSYSNAEELCFATQDAIKVADEIQKCRQIVELARVQEAALKVAETRLAVLEKIADKSAQVIALKTEQIEIQEAAIKNYQKLIEVQTAAIDNLQKAVKPGFFEQLKTMSLGAVIGAIIAGIILAL